MKDMNEITKQDPAQVSETHMGRRKLIQALTAAGGAAILGGLELKWQAPFVQMSVVHATHSSLHYEYYHLSTYNDGASNIESSLKNNLDAEVGHRRQMIMVSNAVGKADVEGSIEGAGYSTFLAKVENGRVVAISEAGIGANANESPFADVIVNADTQTKLFDISISVHEGVEGALVSTYTSDLIEDNRLEKTGLALGSTVLFHITLAEIAYEIVVTVDLIQTFESWSYGNKNNKDYPALAVISMVKITK